jgi:predicted AlkP superfamily pyrophosphatase or phosphodiesterase
MRCTPSYLRVSAVGLSLVAAVACGKPHIVTAPQPPQALALPNTRVSEHVVVVSIDGLRPDAIETFKALTLLRLIDEGAYTLSASTILPSKTLPSHTSMLTGEPPDKHGVLWNTAMEDAPGEIDIPTVFGEARARGYSTAAFFSKSKFSHLQQPGTLDYSQAPGGWFGRWSSTRTIDDVADRIGEAKWNLLFVHLPDPDVAGHANGWMSPEYGKAVIKADAAVARLMQLAGATFGEGNYTIIVTADHGGHDFDHGSDDPRDTAIPWISWGRGVQKGELPAHSVKTMDTAATALYLLGVTQPTAWAGMPVRNAFNGVATAQ